MQRRRPIFLKRAVANEERRHRQAGAEGVAQGAAFRWAGVGVALVIALGVMVGFTDYGAELAARIGGLGWLQERAFLRITWGDVVVVALVALAVVWFLWRDARRARRRTGR